jgi:hypothetical protein
MEQIPAGLSLEDEHEYIRRVQIREGMEDTLDWLCGIRPEWRTNATLTFADGRIAPEAAENCMRRWLKKVAPGSWAVVGWERQQRGAIHAHLVIDTQIDFTASRLLWKHHGFCWFAPVRNQRRQVQYVIKHAIKNGDVEIYGPHAQRQFTTDKGVPEKSPTEYEMEALQELSGKRSGKLA